MIQRPPLRWVVVVLLCSVGASARADIRVWSEETVDDDAAEAAPEEPLHLDITGFIQPAYQWRQDDDEVGRLVPLTDTGDRLLIRRARLGVKALVYPWLAIRMELDATQPVGLRDAWVDFRIAAPLHLRLGQMEVPFLRHWQFRDSWHGFVDGPLYASSPARQGPFPQWRERAVGLMFHGMVGDVEAGPALEYGAGAFATPQPFFFAESAEVLMLAARLEGHILGLPENPEAENDLARSLTPKLSVGLGGETTCDEISRWVRGFTVDAELRWRGLYASTGFVWSKNGTRDGDFLVGPFNYGASDACGRNASATGMEVLPTRIAWALHAQGQYALPEILFPVDGQALEVLARWELARPSAPSDGFFGGDEGSAGYVAPERFDGGYDDPDQWRLTLGLSWYPTEAGSLRLTATYQLRQETEAVQPGSGGPAIDQVDNDVVWVELTAGI